MLQVTVGGVPVLFNAPWQYGIGMGIFEEAGLDVEWKDCHGGTASMTNSLNRGVLDVAVLSTDGAVADIAHGGTYRILSSFVTSPLRYGVYVSAEASDVTDACQLEGCAFAISRRASLSHVMTYLHATQSGWNPREWDATKSSLVEVGNLAGAREALASGRAHGLLWEMGTAKPLVDSGEFRLVGECSPPWPSFVIAVREGMLTGENAETTRRLAAALQTCCAQVTRLNQMKSIVIIPACCVRAISLAGGCGAFPRHSYTESHLCLAVLSLGRARWDGVRKVRDEGRRRESEASGARVAERRRATCRGRA